MTSPAAFLDNHASADRWASATRARPAPVFGPVDNPPWKRQRPFPSSTLTMQVPPARVLAPQSGRSLRRRHHLDRSEFAADDVVIASPVRPHDARTRTRAYCSHKSDLMTFGEFGVCRNLLPIGDPRQHRTALSAFTQGLAESGWTDGRNLRMEVRWGGGDVNRTRTFAKELVALQPEVILAQGTPGTAALQRETPMSIRYSAAPNRPTCQFKSR
jgi:hypothetical protein